MRKFFNNMNKTLRNYSFLSMLLVAVALVGALVDAGGFICYQLSGRDPVINTDRKGQLTNALANQPILGMAFFLIMLVGFILEIAVIYKAFSYTMPKDKMVPNKLLPIFSAASGVLHLASIPFYAIIIGENGRTQVGIIICLALSIVVAIAQLLFIYPSLLGRFTMPELVNRKEKAVKIEELRVTKAELIEKIACEENEEKVNTMKAELEEIKSNISSLKTKKLFNLQ